MWIVNPRRPIKHRTVHIQVRNRTRRRQVDRPVPLCICDPSTSWAPVASFQMTGIGQRTASQVSMVTSTLTSPSTRVLRHVPWWSRWWTSWIASITAIRISFSTIFLGVSWPLLSLWFWISWCDWILNGGLLFSILKHRVRSFLNFFQPVCGTCDIFWGIVVLLLVLVLVLFFFLMNRRWRKLT